MVNDQHDPSPATEVAPESTETEQVEATEPTKRRRAPSRRVTKAKSAAPDAEQQESASVEDAAPQADEAEADASAADAQQPEAQQPDAPSLDAPDATGVAPELPASVTQASAAQADADPADADPADDGAAAPVAPASPFMVSFVEPDFASMAPLPARHDDDDDDDDEDDDEPRGRQRQRRGRQRTREVEPQQITEPQKVKGSTRLEAKRQRRRDGRDAGRRRTVVTESEFLARREAVERTMIVRSKSDRVQLGVLEDGVLVEHYVAKSSESSIIGNVYLGRVQNVLPSMEAAFVDIGRGRNAVLYSGEVDWDSLENDNTPRRIELALKPGDTVLVQVSKDPIGHKGARLTSQISLPGRYLVYVPGGSMNGISRKLPDTERARLKKILKQVLPENVGVIVRTAAEGATEDQLTRDVERLTKQWSRIQQQVEKGTSPQRLHAEPDLLVKIVRDVFNEDFQKLVIQGSEALTTIREYLEAIAPDLLERVEPYEGTDDPFDHFRIAEQIEKALDRKVWLPSGGSLVIDRTEAMTVVDVNTGRFVGAGGNLEETVTKNNLEAAEEIVKQLRLRDIGGIIVIDFIDMVLESNRDLVSRRLVECLSRDRTKHQVAEVTSLGLVQMTRKRLGLGLLESYSEPCEICAGRGVIVHHEPVSRSHRQSESNGRGAESGSNRRRGGRSKGQQPAQQHQQQSGVTHAITDDLRKGLSMIAASTAGKRDDAELVETDAIDTASIDTASIDTASIDTASIGATSTEATSTDAASTDADATATASDDAGSTDGGAQRQRREPRERRGRRERREPREQTVDQYEDAAKSGVVELGVAAIAEADAQATVTILDIPVEAADAPAAGKRSIDEVDGLLGGALDALSAPKAGQGKAARRSRRATSGVITTNDDQR